MRRGVLYRVLWVTTVAALVMSLALGHIRFQAAHSLLPASGSVKEVLPGLQGTVEIALDERGIPHITATSEHDLYFAQGYVHARDRFFQMDLVRRQATGRLSELFGESTLPADRKARVWRLGATAQRHWAILSDHERGVIEAYSDGVNAALVQFDRWIAPEQWLLFRNPNVWTPLDTLAIGVLFQLDLTGAMNAELSRANIFARLGKARAVDLWGWTPGQAATWIPPGEPANLAYQSANPSGGPGSGIGSNNWALAGTRSSTGRPLLANDSHLPVRMPGSWYAIHLRCPQVNVAGVGIAGTPGVAIGHNESVAWGFTMAALDDQDLYRTVLDPSETEELINGVWQRVRTISERIDVRLRDEPELLKVQVCERGPVVQKGGRETLSLSWTGNFGPSPLRALLRMANASSAVEAAAAWEGVTSPAMNLVAADVGGHLLHHVVGQQPRRGAGAGRLPAPAQDPAWAWQGFFPLEHNPHTLDPANGMVSTANHDLFAEGDYPERQRFPGEFAPGWRVRRIRQLLNSRSRWDVESLHRLQNDVVSPQAQLLLQMEVLRPDLTRHGGRTARQLLAWDGEMRADAAAPLLLRVLLEQLAESIGGDEARQAGLEHSPLSSLQVIRLLQGGIDEGWWDNVETSQIEDRASIVASTLDRVDALNLQHSWGEAHQVRFPHPLARLPLLGRLLGSTFSRGPFPVAGDGTTIAATHSSHRRPYQVVALPALRFVTEVGAWDNTVLVLPVGESGRPFSNHYDDQLAAWLHGRPLQLPFSPDAVARAARAHLTLAPPAAVHTHPGEETLSALPSR